MPQEPKKKHSKARKRTRRASIILTKTSLIICSNCQNLTLSHQACKHCGFYAGKQVGIKAKAQVRKA